MEVPVGHSRLSPEVWKEILAHLPMMWRAMCCRVCKAWQEDLEQPQQGQDDDTLVDYGLGTLCCVLATKGVDEVMRRIRLHYPSGIEDLGRMDQVRRFVQRHRGARIKSVNEWMQLASQEPDAGWLCKGASRTKLEGTGASLMRQVVGKRREFSELLDTRTAHSNHVMCVAYSPDGKHIASASCDQSVKIWDAVTMVEVCSATGHIRGVTCVAYSPDGKHIASGSHDETVKIWDAETQQEVGSLRGHSGYVMCVAYSPDGKHIASGSGRGDDTVKIWDAETKREVCSLEGHRDIVTCVAYSPDGRHIASASCDETVKIWDAVTMAEVCSLRGHSDCVRCVAWSPDGEMIASSSTDKSIRLWSKSGEHKGTLKGHSQTVNCVAYSPNGKRIASASYDRSIKIWDAVTMEEVGTLSGHTRFVYSVAWSPDGEMLASGSQDYSVCLWSKSREQKDTLRGHSNDVTCVAHSPDGTHIASASWDKTVKIWDAETKQEVCILRGHLDAVRWVAFSPDSKYVASCSGWFGAPESDNSVRIWVVSTGKEVRSLKGHSECVRCVAWSADGEVIASSSEDGTIRLWSKSGEHKGTLRGHEASWEHLDPGTEALAAKVQIYGSATSIWIGQCYVTVSGNRVYVYRTDMDGRRQGGALACFHSPASVESLSCKGTSVVVGCYDGQVSLCLQCGANAGVF